MHDGRAARSALYVRFDRVGPSFGRLTLDADFSSSAAGYGAFNSDRDGKRAFNIRAASPSFALLLPILLISRLA
jgi:hypothetical protein